jgi:hypothetical protein
MANEQMIHIKALLFTATIHTKRKKMQAFYLIKYMGHAALLKHNKTELCHTM